MNRFDLLLRSKIVSYLKEHEISPDPPGPSFTGLKITAAGAAITVANSLSWEYSTDKENWYPGSLAIIDTSSEEPVISYYPDPIQVPEGSSIYCRSTDRAEDGKMNMFIFGGDGEIKLSGDISSMAYGGVYPSCYTIMFAAGSQLGSVFNIKDASELIIPEVAESSCAAMFMGCSLLQKAPKITATVVQAESFDNMFSVCTSLTEAWVSTKYFEDMETMFGSIETSGVIHVPTWCNSWEGKPDSWELAQDIDTPFETFKLSAVNGNFKVAQTAPWQYCLDDPTDEDNWHDGPFVDSEDIEFLEASSIYCRVSSEFSGNACFLFGGGDVKVSGSFAALYDGHVSSGYTSLGLFQYMDAFAQMDFTNSLVDASELVISTVWESSCSSMFNGCTRLANTPQLTAMNLAPSCYFEMFEGCTSLTSAPALPATTLASSCYGLMFKGCTSLTSAPALPATTLATECYNSMFEGCTALTSAPALPATTLAERCYQYMFNGCSSLVTAPVLPATKLTVECYDYMFNDCTALTSASVYAAYDSNSMDSMFDGVEAEGVLHIRKYFEWSDLPANWVIAKDLPSEHVAGFVLTAVDGDITIYNDKSWLYSFDDDDDLISGPTSEEDAITVHSGESIHCWSAYSATEYFGLRFYVGGAGKVKASGNVMALALSHGGDLYPYCFRSLFKDCTSLIEAPALPATTLTTYCYASMFEGCTALTSAPDLPATTLASSCYSDMFKGCTSLTSAPALPATTLASACYRDMFWGCSSLLSVFHLPAVTLENYCYEYMFMQCASLTSIYIAASCHADISSPMYACRGMLGQITSSGTLHVSPGDTSWNSEKPTNWSVVDDYNP